MKQAFDPQPSLKIGYPTGQFPRLDSNGHILGYHTEVYDKIDVKMDQRRLKQREKKMREQIKAPRMEWDRLKN